MTGYKQDEDVAIHGITIYSKVSLLTTKANSALDDQYTLPYMLSCCAAADEFAIDVSCNHTNYILSHSPHEQVCILMKVSLH